MTDENNTPSAGIDLATLDVVKATEGVTFDLELLHPVSDAPLGLFIQIQGTYSKAFRDASQAQTNELLLRNFEAQRNAKKAKAPTVEDSERRSSKLLATNTTGWFERKAGPIGSPPVDTPGLPFGAERLLFSTAEAEKLYSAPGYDWLARQVDKAMGELTHFMKA